MNRIEDAIKYKHSGCNCTQSVLMAYKDKLNISEEDILKLSSGFLLGMGNMKGTCGALIAANMLLGSLNESKRRMMTLSSELVDRSDRVHRPSFLASFLPRQHKSYSQRQKREPMA